MITRATITTLVMILAVSVSICVAMLGHQTTAFATASSSPHWRSSSCAPYPDADGDVWLVGEGRCVDAVGNTSSAFACLDPVKCPNITDVDACSIVCLADATCTGFELRPPTDHNATTLGVDLVASTARRSNGQYNDDSVAAGSAAASCFVFTQAAPQPFWTMHNGTQTTKTDRTVVAAWVNASIGGPRCAGFGRDDFVCLSSPSVCG